MQHQQNFAIKKAQRGGNQQKKKEGWEPGLQGLGNRKFKVQDDL